MATVTVSIPVEPRVARAFAGAPTKKKRKLQLLLSLRLQELTISPPRPLKTVMDDVGRKAKTRGMSRAVLDALLHVG